MGDQLRIYRRRIRSVKATKKITKAMELISASRIVKAQQRVTASSPYANELTRAVSALATFSNVDHPLTATVTDAKRAAVLIIASDRGMAGAYASNAIKEGDQLTSLLKSRGLEVDHYLIGRKALNYYRFRNRAIAASWTGFSDNPTYANAKEIADTVITSFLQETGADELHIIYTEFVSMITQRPLAKRMLPLEVVESELPPADGPLPLYEFEPSAADVLDALLPRYVESRIFNALLQSAASEHAARRRAMKSATDNAEELIKSLTRRANAARQAEITQEISEIVGGADALASATSGGE